MPRRNNTQKHTIFTFTSPCKQKKRYDSKLLADQAGKKLSDEVDSYKCDLCGGWHLTHTTSNS
jgi:hypothetical protein